MKPKYQLSPRTFLPAATLLVGLVLGYLIFGRNPKANACLAFS
jgi:hypothetical protein